MYYPTGKAKTSTLHIKKCAPAEVQVGIGFEYVITVANISDQTLRTVVLTDQLAENFNMSNVDPSPTSREARTVLNVGLVRFPSTTTSVVGTGLPNVLVLVLRTYTRPVVWLIASRSVKPVTGASTGMVASSVSVAPSTART